MLSERDVSASIGGTAYSSNGDKIGTVEHYFVDDRTGAPSWVALTTGLFGTRHSIVPASDATFGDGGLRLPVTADAVKSAPHLAGDHLSPDEEAQLRRHYGLEDVVSGAPAWTPSADGLRPPGAADDDDATRSAPASSEAPTVAGRAPATSESPTVAPAPATSESPTVAPAPATSESPTVAPAPVTRESPTVAVPLPPLPPPPYGTTTETTATPQATEATPAPPSDGGMIRNEEQLRVGTERVAATRVRLVKYVVTEEVQITVPIRREEVRIEEVPIDSADDEAGESLVTAERVYGAHSAERTALGGAGGGDGGALPEEIILHTERPVVTVEVVPTERVRLRTELVQGQQTVTEQVQREQIIVDETPSTGRVSPR